MLEHLTGLGEALHRGGLRLLHLRGRDLYPLLQRLGEHGRPHTSRPRLRQLLVHLCPTKSYYVAGAFISVSFFNELLSYGTSKGFVLHSSYAENTEVTT